MFYFILLISVFCISALLLRFKRNSSSQLPPGPRAWPLVGNLLQLNKEDPRVTFVEWHKQFGPVFTVWMGVTPMVLVTGYDQMYEWFVKRGDEFAERPYSYLFQFFAKGNYGISQSVGDLWRDQRRFTLHVLRDFGVGRKVIEEKIQSESAELVQQLYQIVGNETVGATVQMKHLLEVCVGNVISSVILGHTYSYDDKEFVEMKELMDEVFKLMGTLKVQLLTSFPILRFVPLFGHFGFEHLTAHCVKFQEFWMLQINQRKARLNHNEEPNDFVAVYLKEMKRRKDAGESMEYFSEWQLMCIASDVFGAGLETTSNTLYWAILLMMHYSDVQKRIQREIDSVIGRERQPNMGDKIHMPYTVAVMNEVQRYSNLLVINIPHSSNNDVTFGKYKIPAGTTIVPQITALLFDESIFEDARSFNPDRFLEVDGTTLKMYKQFMPFSLGKRQCLGEGLAKMELFLVFVFLLQHFSFDFVEDSTPKPTLKANVGFMASAHKYEARIIKRHV